MSEPLLKVKDLTVNVGEKEILHGLNLDVNAGETHVLMGPNGAGKSTLGNAIMGNPVYEVTGGEIIFDGKNILEETTDQRAKDGLFMSFQNPLEVPGISLSNFIRSSLEQRTGERVRLWDFRKSIKKEMKILQMDESYADRDLNVGFSGGEKKKSEILQLLMLARSLPSSTRLTPVLTSMPFVPFPRALRNFRRLLTVLSSSLLTVPEFWKL